MLRYLDDDEDFAADEASGDWISGDEDGSTPEPPVTVYYRVLVNFTDSFTYGPELDDIFSTSFQEISAAVVDTLESEYQKIPGTQTVNVVLIKKIGNNVFVELDVGSDDNNNEAQIRDIIYSVVSEGSIASYVTSVLGFQFRRLGELPGTVRSCLADEFACNNGMCIPLDYVCDKRADCSDMSDEENCGTNVIATVLWFLVLPATDSPAPTTTPVVTVEVKPPPGPVPCRADQAMCQSGECISREYLCDGERDCRDGSDELKCGTPSPCEPNEFKCQNGRCALKLWRCDGDNDCQDNSDEIDCPAKRPGDTCAPEQFVCLSDRACIPASYQCDEEPDCADRSDEYGCAPPTVTSPPEESVSAVRGQTVTFSCTAVGVPTPIITWRLNWGHIPVMPLSCRISMTSENGQGTLTIRDVKEGDQGAYTCEAINAKGLVFAIPDGVLTLSRNCPEGHFNIGGNCLPCFCFGITKNCQSTGRYRNQISLRFREEDDFKGVNVSFPTRPGTPPPLTSTQLFINPEEEEFQLVDLSRRFLDLDSYWTLPRQFLGSKVDSYGGYLRYKVSYSLQRDGSEPVDKPDVVLRGNGQRLIYRRSPTTSSNIKNERQIRFTEENWQHSSGQPVSREDLLMTLGNLESIGIRTVYDNRMASVGLSDIVMDTTSMEFSLQGQPKNVEECRCPPGYSGLSCETCSSGFERVPGGRYLGTCAGCNCHGHANACDPVSGHCLSCQHNTEGPQCEKCRPGYFGDPSRGRSDDCKPCPCPFTETSRRFSDTCFLDVDGQATCDACRSGYTGRRCERCAPGYAGNPLLPNGKCVPANVAGGLCDECKPGSFHLTAGNPDGCLQCFCMGVTKRCASSTWTRDQVRGGVNGQLFSLSNGANTRTITEGIGQKGSTEIVFRSFNSIPSDIYYWVLPESFRGDKVTAYGGELRYKVRFEHRSHSLVIDGQPDVILQGNGIFLEHSSQTKPLPRVPATITVPFRESAWRRADGQPCTREHLLMALADVNVFMIRATYADSMAESRYLCCMDIAVPHSTGNERALEVEECACPPGYRGPSCQECDVGYTRTGSGLYLGTCEKCECHGHASSCDSETGACLQCLHNTAGPRCESCVPGFFGNPVTGGIHACRPCPCRGPAPGNNGAKSCYLDTDGQPTCNNCPPGYTGRRCERCAPGYTGNPELGQSCSLENGNCYSCDPRGSDGCTSNGICRCKMNVEGPSCSSCKSGSFHLSPANKDGCLMCFCMGVTQQCSSSSYYRDVTTGFAPGNTQGFALVNRQRTSRIDTGFSVEVSTDGTQLSFTGFDHLGQEPHYWQLPNSYQGDKVGSYGGKLKYTVSYVPGPRGAPIDDVDVQIIGNDITLVARQDWRRGQGTRESRQFEIVFREENWKRPDGMPATREHLMMVLADLDDILIRASYHTEMRSSSISGVSMEVAVPNYTGLTQALEVEQCRCPPSYHGLSCQDCAPGYTRTGGGLYLGHCELCECNGHSDSCHPETGVCTNCLHNTMGELCEQCSPGYFGDASAGTPEDCQPCACPHTDPENQFSPTCESLGNGGYQCTACQPGYTGQYCERCAPGYVGNPNGCACLVSAAASLVVKVYPERVLAAQGSPVTLRCQASGTPPHYFYWTREDGRPISRSAERRRQGEELHFPSVQPSDAGVYTCTCRDRQHTNRSHAEIVCEFSPSKPIEVFIEEPKVQSVTVGATVSFICTAKSKSPAYTLVWTRQGNGKLPNRVMDFNGILTIPNVQPEDYGVYVCTGSNMFGMDESSAVLHVQAAEGSQPVATVQPPVLTIQQGQRAEFHCTATGNPTPAVEWTGGPGNRISSSAIIRGGVLTFPSVERSDEGDYICRALNTHGEHTARAILYVHSASLPHVQVSPQHVEIHEGETLRLYCRAGGTPSPGLTWKKRGGTLPPQRTDFGTLIIPNMKMSDAGTYLCVGTNAVGSSEARIEVTVIEGNLVISIKICFFFLRLGDTVSNAVTIQPSIATVVEGETLDLNCIVPGNPPPSVTWTRANGYLSSNHQVFGTQLRILRASQDDSGEYICRVDGGPHIRQASVSVSVTSESSRKRLTHSGSPIISIEPHSAAVKLGESASFRCRVYSGAQPVRLEWKLANNQPLPDNVKIGPGSSVITITNAQPKNQGTYRCVASNLFGITHSIVSLIVRGMIICKVLTPKGPLRVKVGEPINLECQAAGEPRPSVTWHRLDNRVNRRKFLSSVLQILVARPEDSGTYVCIAQNNQGTTETRIEVIVEGGPEVPTVPRVSVREPLMIVVEGATTTLHCDAHGFPKPTVTWSKLRAPLPWRHKIVNGSLVLPNVGRQDSGQYICNATNHMGTSEVTIMLDVETPPYTTTLPDDVAVRVGEVIRLQCLAHGTPPLQYEWSKVDGSLPATAERQGGDLQINLASPSDAGTYRCVASNKVGRSEALAKVSVRSPLSVRVSPQVDVKALGSAVEFTCSANGGPEIKLEWLKEGGALPPNHHVKDGVLRIENLEKSNEGIYICRATSMYGQAQDSAKLTIQALPKVMINVRTSVQTVMVGNSVEFECQAIGEPKPTVHWSKVGGSLPDHVQVKGGMLKIEQVTEADAGQYRCTATNDVGSVQSTVVLNIQSLPQIAAQPETKEVTVGSTAVFPCIASGYPVPTIAWSKLEGELAPKCVQDAHVLTVPDVNHEDAGTYVCTASNKQGKVQAFTKLKVHERVMPYFSQEPLSYLTLPTIKNSYKAFNVKIIFRPDNVDGMILYNGQKKTMGADFVSFGLVGGRPEFRFDVGSGMATIRYPTAIKLGEFHTVQLYRNGTQGSLTVDQKAPINGSSQGKFQGLDLNEELFVGGYPNYSMIAKTAELKTGFVGCISQLIIQGEEIIFKDLDRSSTGVTNCPTCKDRPCQNSGVCHDSVASLYKCSCPRGFTGKACGPDATCINRPTGTGYDCRCHLGKFGNKCMDGTLVTTPLFDGEDSYIAYPPLTNIHNDLRIDMEFKPMDTDGLMFFSGGKKMKVEDFVALSMVDGHIEFRYELGTGQAVLRSQEPVSVGQWHRVAAERVNKDGSLKVDHTKEIRRSSPGKAQGLNIHTPMYLGGVPSMDILPKPANVTMLFDGCIGEVSINGKKVDLSYSFTESRAISQCRDESPCDRRPCQNGGSCMPSAEYEFQCFCRDGYEGEPLCSVLSVLLKLRVCQCSHVGESPHAWSRIYLLVSHKIHRAVYCILSILVTFLLVVNNYVVDFSSPDSPETIELEINTLSPDGLILWQGVVGSGTEASLCYLHLITPIFPNSYQLGSGEAQILSRERVNDGQWHKITAVRTGKQGYIQVDDGSARRGQSQGKSIMVNTKGNIYLGGAPDMTVLTGGKFSSGITGCVKNLSLMNARPGDQPARPIDLQVHAEEGVNVRRCGS
uniref:Heparan sulfate proteoglycan 2 n=1 Tax=Pygocentrus nattereri TaxID=42514 RepID=A0AAR2JID5_PYGNA